MTAAVVGLRPEGIAMTSAPEWPHLGYRAWRDTGTTFQLWTQVIGKVRLALAPWVNHGWQVPLYVNVHGLGTSPIDLPDGRVLEIDFDLAQQALVIRTSESPDRRILLAPMSVAAFHHRVMSELASLEIDVRINEMPSEVAAPIRFSEDTVHATYDAQAAYAFWRALVQATRVMRLFRTSFLGKCSPVHFFWGSFDLAVTRFSGRAAPLHPGGIPGLPDAITREAYSHEVSSAGFWPGNDAYPQAAFYSYAYPAPEGFSAAAIEPAGAVWAAEMGEWLLPYEVVRTAKDPDAALLRFLETTYRAAADLGGWDRALECGIGVPGQPRPVG
jgi:hypothetical protein